MSLIIDANVVSLVFDTRPHCDFVPIKDALVKRKAVAVYGGKLAREYARLSKFRKLFIEFDRSGSLKKIADAQVNQVESELVATRACASDDPHIIALAKVSGARLLCSNDRTLHADFTNPHILNPSGAVYQNQSHSHLIRRFCAHDV